LTDAWQNGMIFALNFSAPYSSFAEKTRHPYHLALPAHFGLLQEVLSVVLAQNTHAVSRHRAIFLTCLRGTFVPLCLFCPEDDRTRLASGKK
jgi:hypothetical protein